MDVELDTAVGVIWFRTCKTTRRDVAGEGQTRLAEVGITKLKW